MKTAISLSNGLFKAGEVLARRFGVTRSELYAMALEEFIARHSEKRASERLDAVYSAEPPRLDPSIAAAQARVVKRSDW